MLGQQEPCTRGKRLTLQHTLGRSCSTSHRQNPRHHTGPTHHSYTLAVLQPCIHGARCPSFQSPPSHCCSTLGHRNFFPHTWPTHHSHRRYLQVLLVRPPARHHLKWHQSCCLSIR